MNVLGIGPMELLVIFLVAFLALGPGKSIDAARTVGKVVREARRTFAEVIDAASIDDLATPDGQRRESPPPTGTTGPTVAPPSDPLPTPAHLHQQDSDANAGASETDANNRPT